MKKVLVLGGDGFCGWATSLHLSDLGHDVSILDNLSRREIAGELEAPSLTPIKSPYDRVDSWKCVSGKTIRFYRADIAEEPDILLEALQRIEPDVIIHFAEQRAAPYSMKTLRTRGYTVDNNISATHNVLSAIVESGQDIHLVHLGTMGVYGYGTAGAKIPEGYQDVLFNPEGDSPQRAEILYPANPGSIYHMTKCMDQLMFAYYAKNFELRITDLHQGIVWGTQTDTMLQSEYLINRFDYDGDYGTVLNRFLMQAAIDHPLTVHGTGGQTRAFIHIKDSIRCLQLAIENPPATGDRVKILNQMTETHRLIDLANRIADITGAKIMHLENPRKEAAENDLDVCNDCFVELGLKPTLLSDGLLTEITDIAEKYKDSVVLDTIVCKSLW